MIESVRLENFRCFRSVSADSLQRINVIAGRNASGKTALLEAIFLASGSTPEIAFRLKSWRGLGDAARIALDRSSVDALWGDLFYNFDRTRPLSVALHVSGRKTRSLRIETQTRKKAATIHGPDAEEPIEVLPIRFTWKSAGGENLVIEPQITAQGLRIGNVGVDNPAVFLHSTAAQVPQEIAARFSQLSRRNEEGSVLEALQSEYPFLRSLSVELNAGAPTVFGAIDGLSQKIPLALVSSGINKLLGLLVAIAETREGTVCIDEIENGFYHDRLPGVWTMLVEFCERHDCQLFCTTHSRECLESLATPLSTHKESFALVRVEGDGEQRKLRTFLGEDLLPAVLQHAELR